MNRWGQGWPLRNGRRRLVTSRTPLRLPVGPVWGNAEGVDAHEVNRARAKLALFVADVFASVPRKDQRAKSD